jgi:hypothetical protein
MQRWLCLLANPMTSAPANLRDALASPALPAEVRGRFAEVCARRRLWREHIARKLPGPAPVPEPGSWKTDTGAVWLMANGLLDSAGRHATRHPDCGNVKDVRDGGAKKEAAWLLARLTELLQEAAPAPSPAPEPALAGKRVTQGAK